MRNRAKESGASVRNRAAPMCASVRNRARTAITTGLIPHPMLFLEKFVGGGGGRVLLNNSASPGGGGGLTPPSDPDFIVGQNVTKGNIDLGYFRCTSSGLLVSRRPIPPTPPQAKLGGTWLPSPGAGGWGEVWVCEPMRRWAVPGVLHCPRRGPWRWCQGTGGRVRALEPPSFRRRARRRAVRAVTPPPPILCLRIFTHRPAVDHR